MLRNIYKLFDKISHVHTGGCVFHTIHILYKSVFHPLIKIICLQILKLCAIAKKLLHENMPKLATKTDRIHLQTDIVVVPQEFATAAENLIYQ